MTTLFYSHQAFMGHDAGPGHPENAGRLQTLLDRVAKQDPIGLDRREAPLGTAEQIDRIHVPGYREQLLAAVPQQGHVRIDADTVLSPGSGEAGLRAVGGVCAAIDAVIAGEAENAFCASRPPGHHAEPNRPMGFCLFSTVAIGAAHARAAHGIRRVSIIDFDVHHGNGTEAAFRSERDVQYLSTHQWPLFPGTGARGETGVGNVVNVPLPAGTGSGAFREAVETDILPAIEAFAPELILVSAGFDAHKADPLATMRLEEADFAWITRAVRDLAERHSQGRIVAVLEGGYDPVALAASAWAHLDVLLGT
ncbi:histone deacetylase family protein [Marinivivus vitaminiproducens]|uniref:histone deacetylase family protein n=1 Tax=Marinivivus vitaminiproducens TaxID=3035935 RepID=UPI00279B1213|nr:histone deacetylase family protein [Geminicoccaceae bacterium SCSIO 64248]